MEKENKCTKLADNYEYSKDGILYYIETKSDKDGSVFEERTRLSNHTPLLKEYHKIDNGVEVNEEIVFNVLRNFRMSEDIALTNKDIMGQTPNLKFGAANYIEPSKSSVNRYRMAMHKQCEAAPCPTIYQHTGYATIDGERVFLNGEYSVTKDGLTDKYTVILKDTLSRFKFTADKDNDRYKTLLVELPKVAPKPVIYSTLSLSFLSPLNALLREIGLEPQFILYFVGKTGSFKSTIAKLFLNFFGDFTYTSPAPANFKDTVNAIEYKLGVVDSMVNLVDDLRPDTTSSDGRHSEQVQQSLLRGIGDRIGRARLNSDMTMRATYIPKCNVIITAEQAYSNVGESGVARSIAVELPHATDDILQVIRPVQDKANHLNQCMSEYIQYVICNWDSLKIELKAKYNSYIDVLKMDGHARLNADVAHLQLGIYMFCKWLVSINIISENDSVKMQNESLPIFKKLAEEQNKRIADEKPEKMFITGLNDLMTGKNIHFIQICKGHTIPLEEIKGKFVGYYDDDYYYCIPSEIYATVREHYAKQGINFPLTKQALFKHLADENYIEGDSKQTTKKKRVDKSNTRYLWLKRSVVDNSGEEE